MTNAMNAIANQVIRNSGRSTRNAGWPYFDGMFRDYPVFKRKFASFRANYHRGTPTQELFQQFREMCLPEKIAAKLKRAETMETAWVRLDAWLGYRGLFIKDLMQDIKNVTPIKDGDDERLMDYYEMLQSHIAEARNAGLLEMLLTSQLGDDGAPALYLGEESLERGSRQITWRGQSVVHGGVHGGPAGVRYQRGRHKRAARAAQADPSA